MRALLLAALLAPGAAALDAEAPGAPALRMRDTIQALPFENRLELRRMYMRYREEVAARTEQGWSPGLLSDAVIEGVDEPFQPARLLEEEDQARHKELADLEAASGKVGADSADDSRFSDKIGAKKEAADSAREKNAREKGICRDWSDDVWFVLTKMDLDQWVVDDRHRIARPFHTGAVACSPPESPTVCLVFDPWTEGKPSVYAYQAWDAKLPGGRLPAEYLLHGLPEKAP